jgi:hypothetical protein
MLSLLDMPMRNNNTCNANISKFNNQYEFKNVNNVDDFFISNIKHKSWFINHTNEAIDKYSINLTDLFELDALLVYLQKFEDIFNETLPRKNIEKIHKVWVERTNIFINDQ